MKKPDPKALAYEEARRRIALWREGETLNLGIEDLETLPPEIAALKGLVRLWLTSHRIDEETGREYRRSISASVADLTPVSGLASLEVLDVSCVGLADLSPLAGLINLQELWIEGSDVTSLKPLAGLKRLRRLECSDVRASDLSPLAGLTELEELALFESGVTTLKPLSGLKALRKLNCSSTPVKSLEPLRELVNLQELDCSIGMIEDLEPLRKLKSLRKLNFYDTEVKDLSPLAGLSALEELCCSYTEISGLRPIARLPALVALNCGGTNVDDLKPLSNAPALRKLECYDTKIFDLEPLGVVQTLASLDVRWCDRLRSLEGLSGLQNLEEINTENAGLTRLGSLRDLPALKELNIAGTKIEDLGPLSSLTSLERLDCAQTSVADLSPLASLLALECLYLFQTPVSDLTPLAGLTSLRELGFYNTGVKDLGPLASLSALEEIYCSGTGVTDLSPLASLPALEEIDCSGTGVTDLTPLAGLARLRILDLSETGVTDLTPLLALKKLKSLGIQRLRLTRAPAALWESPNLESVHADEASIPGVPSELLRYNALPALRAHYADLEGGEGEELSDARLMILGNGRVGKTQILRRLRAEAFDPNADSTHGIAVSSCAVPEEQAARFHVWDFGGQDIYHGTHALFLRMNAVFLVVWSPETEEAAAHTHRGLTFRNDPLPYWLDHLYALAGPQAPVVVVQTRCDAPDQARPLAPEAAERLQRFAFHRVVAFSSKTDFGREALEAALREAWALLDKPRLGPGRMAVRRRLEAMRAAQTPRWLTMEAYEALCEEAGSISDPARLLEFLHRAGVVYHQEEVFGGRILVDQAWALEAIYAVFHRDGCHQELLRRQGRFTRGLLGELLWDRLGHGPEDQKRFIEMMDSCAICFEAPGPWRREVEYIACDLLPEEEPAEAEALWREEGSMRVRRYGFDALSPMAFRSILHEICGRCWREAIFWRYGTVLRKEKGSDATARIEKVSSPGGGWSGEIVLSVRNDRSGALYRDLEKRLSDIFERQALSPKNVREEALE